MVILINLNFMANFNYGNLTLGNFTHLPWINIPKVFKPW